MYDRLGAGISGLTEKGYGGRYNGTCTLSINTARRPSDNGSS
jgi:hypothetical protein